MEQFLMGNEAVALGAIAAGVGLVAGYPGTPSTEALETVAKRNPGPIHVEWSVNEKAALEIAAGASYAGLRTMVTMKQVGLNVASDPLMSLRYIGVKGGMVLYVADDPGPISSQTEQDTRKFAQFAKTPLFDASSPEEAYAMVQAAFETSEKYATPVILRSTTRVCHACAVVDVAPFPGVRTQDGFQKDSRWVIFPRLSYQSHMRIEKEMPLLGEELSDTRWNPILSPVSPAPASGAKGVACGGVASAYVREALKLLGADCRLFQIGTPFPFPEKQAIRFLDGLDEVLVLEELDHVIERELTYLCGKHHLPASVRGKLTGHSPAAGELSVEIARKALAEFLGLPTQTEEIPAPPPLPVRPPVLCAGCPHRASFFAVKTAMKGKKAFFTGDIGCYTLGNAAPLDMVDTCLCMGADVTIAQGLRVAEPDAKVFAFIGDSTFFASGITGVVNAVYNQHSMTLVVLDNSTTAMTGHQPHPGTGKTVMGDVAQKISIYAILKAIGVEKIWRVNPLDQRAAVAAAKEAGDTPGVSAILFESPCIAVTKPGRSLRVDPGKCIGCKKCIRELGCPALTMENAKAKINPSLCTGCTLCSQVCPCGAIGQEGEAAQ